MSVEVFVDTNVLYYAHTESPDPRHAFARTRLRTLWDQPGSAAISVQVLQELHVNLVRKAGLPAAQSADLVGQYLSWRVIDNDRALLKAAFEVQSRFQLSFWDCLIVAAAQRAGAAVLWSEDLSDTQRYGELTVVNPLRSA